LTRKFNPKDEKHSNQNALSFSPISHGDKETYLTFDNMINYYANLVSLIRKYDTNHLILSGSLHPKFNQYRSWKGMPIRGKKKDTVEEFEKALIGMHNFPGNVAIGVHYYNKKAGFAWYAEQFGKNPKDYWDTFYIEACINASKKAGKPFYLGEFAECFPKGDLANGGKAPFVEAVFELMKKEPSFQIALLWSWYPPTKNGFMHQENFPVIRRLVKDVNKSIGTLK